jgi:hypothetical protein
MGSQAVGELGAVAPPLPLAVKSSRFRELAISVQICVNAAQHNPVLLKILIVVT